MDELTENLTKDTRPTREECVQKAARILARAILRIKREKLAAEMEAAGSDASAITFAGSREMMIAPGGGFIRQPS